MQPKDSKQAYGWVSIVLHWIVGATVLAMISFSYGYGVEIFGFHLLSTPLETNIEMRAFFASMHYVNGCLIVALIALHAAGALKHLIIDRDKVLQRMLWSGNK